MPNYHGRRFELIDTGGIVLNDQEYIPAQILHRGGGRVRAGSRPYLFLMDGRAEITARRSRLGAEALSIWGVPSRLW